MNLEHQGLIQIKGAVEAVGFQHVTDAAAEAFDHAVGLRGFGRSQAVFDTQFSAEPVGELFSIIRQYLGSPDRAGPVQIAQKAAGVGSSLGRHDAHENPAYRPPLGDAMHHLPGNGSIATNR